ncbi:ankyrin repeat-containing domain protein [Cercophora samala]|uniref:Ankyrin repeat-containing domain protein n=1 Tax=Cercophora samala TaxID=330535 RepID=A0AA39Z9M7_9PEZI|nr:ankyrin repeat-containing domain protein [Cercophora samala]
MEPLSILGAVAACSEIVTVIARVTTNLHSLKQRWSEGARSLQLLIAKLSTVRAALAQVKDWAELNASTSPNGEEMRDNLGVAMEGCQVFIEALDQDVAGLLGDSVVTRLKQLFIDSTIKEHEQRLDSQISALQVLLNAAYCQNLSEQNSLLRQTAARQVFQQIREDTSTVREQSTVRDTERSTIAGTEAAPAPSTRLGRIDSFTESTPDTVLPFGIHIRPPSRSHENDYPVSRDPTWQRPMPFEMLPYSPSSTPMSPASDRSSNTSGFFSLGKAVSSTTSLSAETLPKSPPSTIRQRFGRLRLSSSSSSRASKEAATMSPKSQLSIRFPGEFVATDMYLQSDGNHPPPKPIVAAQRGDHVEMASLIRRRADLDHPHRGTGRTPLAVACHCGHNDVVELLIAEGANVNSKDKRKLSPLHLAAANGHCHVMATLLDREADINARGPYGKTPLRIACDHGQLDAIRFLAKLRAMVDSRDEAHKTPLHAASEAGDNEIAKLLLQLGANKDAKDSHMRTPLHSASISGRVSVVETLINAKADLEAQEEESLTPLATAARAGLTAVMDLLLQHKASPRTRSAGDFTPLHWASYNSHEEAVGLLIANKKTELDARSINGRSPLHVAGMGRSFGVIEKLVRAGASLEAECLEGNRPLHYACQYATHSEVSLLLNAGASCNVQNMTGETPLHIAVRTGSVRTVKALVARGAHVDSLDNKTIRPLAIACRDGHAEIANFLLTSGAVIKRATDAPMCLAASGGHVQVIQALLQHGGAVREVDAQGWDPLRRAAFAGHSQAVASLLGNGARATNLGTLSSFSFASTATAEQRKRILDLLTMAIDTENAEYQRVTYLASSAMPLNVGQENVTELPDTRSRTGQQYTDANEGLPAPNPPPSPPLRPPPSPSRPPPAIPQIFKTADGEPDLGNQEYYYERESTRPAPYSQPAPEAFVDSRNQQQQVPILQRFLPYRPPSPSQGLTPSYLSPYTPGPISPPETQYYGYTPSNYDGPVSPPDALVSPPSSLRVSPPPPSSIMSTYTSAGVSAISGTTSAYYPYPRPVTRDFGTLAAARSEALYPVRTGTDGNRAELP